MNQWANTILTEKGTALLAKLTQGNTLTITKAVTGAGYVNPTLLVKQTEITDPKGTLEFRPVSYPEEGKCAITVRTNSDAITVGYTALQVGLFAQDPDDGEILFLICQAADVNSGTIIPSATEMPGYSAEWTFYLAYGQANGVAVTVDPAGAVTQEEMEEYVGSEMQKKPGQQGSNGGEIFNDYTNNVATGSNSHAEGTKTIAKGNSQHVHGRFNIEDTENRYVQIVGNGGGVFENGVFVEKRSNAYTLDWDGNAWFAGAVDVEDPDTTRENIGAAPDGYGVGKLTSYQVANDQDIDTVLTDEIANMSGQTFKRIVLSFTAIDNFSAAGGHYYTDIYKLSTNYAMITIKSYIAGGRSMQRIWFEGELKPWEWINPPMVVGVEYRTTERYKNEVVYVQLKSDGIIHKRTESGLDITPIRFGTEDLVDGQSPLAPGCLYFVYE